MGGTIVVWFPFVDSGSEGDLKPTAEIQLQCAKKFAVTAHAVVATSTIREAEPEIAGRGGRVPPWGGG
jgi:hypothetical protein